jgi:hypothetical protein
VAGPKVKSKYVPVIITTNHLLGPFSSAFTSSYLPTALPATILVPFAPAGRVKDAIGMHYSNLGFAIGDITYVGLDSNFNSGTV